MLPACCLHLTGIWLAFFLHHDLISYITIYYPRSGAKVPLALFVDVLVIKIQKSFEDFKCDAKIYLISAYSLQNFKTVTTTLKNLKTL